MALFAGAVIKDKRLAFAMPLLAMFLSDLLFEVFKVAPGFWGWGQLVHYFIYAGITCFGFLLRRITVMNVAIFSLSASLLFYFLSNSAVFFFDNPVYHLYAPTFKGYIDCLAAGLPFLKTAIIADLVYSTILFGGYYLMEKGVFSKWAA
jgi:hypothetical protein